MNERSHDVEQTGSAIRLERIDDASHEAAVASQRDDIQCYGAGVLGLRTCDCRRRYVARLKRVLQVEQIGVGAQKTASSARVEQYRRTAQADAADVADLDDLAVAEAGGAQVDALLLGLRDRVSLLDAGREGHLRRELGQQAGNARRGAAGALTVVLARGKRRW